MTGERVAVIGAGVSGLTAAYLLRNRYHVRMFEAAAKPGGHADTHDVRTPDGRTLAIDTGFLVHNETTYPTLVRLFRELSVRTNDTEMSLSVRCTGCGLEYAGGKRRKGMIPGGGHAVLRPYLGMLGEIGRFYRSARALLHAPDERRTLHDVLVSGRYSPYFVEHFAIPLVSTVWSAGATDTLRYPAAHLFTFLKNHGMLSPTGSLRWRTVVGGARTYVERIVAALPEVLAGAPVRTVRRHFDGIDVVTADGAMYRADRVVVATHADQALRMLADPMPEEKRVLGAFRYTRNETWLHRDATVLPSRRRTRAAWNYVRSSCMAGSAGLVSYDINRLMGLGTAVDHIVTLNGAATVDEATVIAKMRYEHPLYTPSAVAAQPRLRHLGGPRTAYAGAYHGWGFHEDGCVSGVRAAAAFGATW
ncbi:FAD-dependent oxidoreductase [Amycolatopsis sp. NPDC049691]|uniref:NAD(P)/FAD-dependent oxidoreductase n=1 Tax=Amycolatopsis sp. NPDC049691 TaxID=3155155 RepID=UPI0034146FE8